MQLGEGVEWTVHCCTVLAVLPEGTTLPSARLAEYHEVAPAYLAKHLQALREAGIVTSSTGRNGGYRLARPPGEISLLDVVLAVEGRQRAFRCTEIRQQGPASVPGHRYPKPCGIAAAMYEAEDAWRAVLADHTIADMVGEALTNARPEALEQGATWLHAVITKRGAS